MARTTVSYDLSTDTGWTYDSGEAQFSGSLISMLATETATTLESPAKATTGWGQLYRVEVGVIEEVDVDSIYYHRFLISFDGGTTYKGPGVNGRLLTVAIGDIATDGFTAHQFNEWREWPTIVAGTTSIKIAIGIVRTIPTVNEADGFLGQLDLIHGIAGGATYDAEPDGCDDLPYGSGDEYSGPEPDFPISFSFDQAGSGREFISDSGHSHSVRQTDFPRLVYDLQWNGRNQNEIDDLEEFLDDHHDAVFRWLPPGESTHLGFIAETYSRTHQFVGSGGAEVGGFRCRWIQVPHDDGAC